MQIKTAGHHYRPTGTAKIQALAPPGTGRSHEQQQGPASLLVECEGVAAPKAVGRFLTNQASFCHMIR